MANKKYYWLKLKKDFFKDRRMKKLRKIAGGPVYTIIYLKLQLLSLDNNGIIEFEGVEDNLVEELELEIDETKEDIQATLFLLEKWGIAEMKEDDLFLPEVIENTGKETASTIRSRKSRERKKIEVKDTKLLHCNTSATICNTEIEKELEKELLLKDKKNSGGDIKLLLKPYKIHWQTVESISRKLTAEEAQQIISHYEKNHSSNGWGTGSLVDMLKSNTMWEVKKKKDTGKPKKLYTGKKEEELVTVVDEELSSYKEEIKELGISQVPKPLRMAFTGALRAATTTKEIENIVMDYSINRTL